MSLFKTVICFLTTLSMCFSVNSGESLKDQPVFGQEHLRESHFVKGVMELYPSLLEPEARKVIGLVNYYSQEMNILPIVALAVIGTESEFVRTAHSSTGVGYTQVYPKYHKKKIQNRDLFKTQVNIEVGMRILQECKERTLAPGYRAALACFNGAISYSKAERYYKKIREQEKRILAKVYQVFMTSI